MTEVFDSMHGSWHPRGPIAGVTADLHRRRLMLDSPNSIDFRKNHLVSSG